MKKKNSAQNNQTAFMKICNDATGRREINNVAND